MVPASRCWLRAASWDAVNSVRSDTVLFLHCCEVSFARVLISCSQLLCAD
jgi:hypothetical protein